MGSSDSYEIIQVWIRHPKFQSYSEFGIELYPGALLGLLQIYNPSLYNHIKSLEVDPSFTQTWFSRIFVNVVPFQVALLIFDYYLYQGISYYL